MLCSFELGTSSKNMNKFLKFIFLSVLILTIPVESVAQLNIEVESVEYVHASRLKVEVKLQNLGSRTQVFVPYGQRASMNINLDERDDIGIFLRYRPQGRDHLAKRLPSSIVTKTALGGTIEADAFQSIPSTGASSYQLWEILFPVSPNALDVSINLFGKVVDIRDREGAKKQEKERRGVALEYAKRADSLVKEREYREAVNEYSNALQKDERIISSFVEGYAESLFRVGNDELKSSRSVESVDRILQAYRYADEYQLPTKQKIASKLSALYAEIGQDSLQANDFGDALWFYQRARQLDESNKKAIKGIGLIKEMKRDPQKAFWLSVFPGLGQFYNKRYLEGILFSTGGALFGGAATSSILRKKENSSELITLYIGLAILSMYRANSQAHSINDQLFQHGSSVERFSISVGPSNRGFNFALRIGFNF